MYNIYHTYIYIYSVMIFCGLKTVIQAFYQYYYTFHPISVTILLFNLVLFQLIN